MPKRISPMDMEAMRDRQYLLENNIGHCVMKYRQAQAEGVDPAPVVFLCDARAPMVQGLVRSLGQERRGRRAEWAPRRMMPVTMVALPAKMAGEVAMQLSPGPDDDWYMAQPVPASHIRVVVVASGGNAYVDVPVLVDSP
jgi:hypothetical protein